MRKIPLLAVLATLVLSTVAMAAADKPADKTPAAEKALHTRSRNQRC